MDAMGSLDEQERRSSALALDPAPHRSPVNVADQVTEILRWGFAEDQFSLELRRRLDDPADLRVILRPGAMDSERLPRVRASIEALPAVGGVAMDGNRLLVELDRAHLAAIGRELEAGTPFTPSSVALATPHLVGYLAANTCKALHLGHLRNIVLGNALTSALRTAGVPVVPYSLVGDIGRSICEAMAGLMTSGDELSSGEKADHVAGRIYSEYVAVGAASRPVGDENDPCAREAQPWGDLADVLMTRWRQAEPAARDLWTHLRSTIMDGHRRTLAELGVTIDEWWYESSCVDEAVDLFEDARRRGVVERSADGTIVFDTGREEFRVMPLVRSDGFPTEHARIIAVQRQIFARADGPLVHAEWTGGEWESAQTVLHEIMDRLGIIPEHVSHRPLSHGMVLVDGVPLSSSKGQVPLIDDLIVRLRDTEAIRELADSSCGGTDVRVLADIVLKGLMLCAPAQKPLDFSWGRLLDPTLNPGWTLARAWARASGPRSHHSDGSVGSLAHRTLVVQAMESSLAIEATAADLDVRSGARFVVRFAKLYLSLASDDERLRRIAHTVLASALDGLGFDIYAVPRADRTPPVAEARA